jgi:hypothetical protein
MHSPAPSESLASQHAGASPWEQAATIRVLPSDDATNPTGEDCATDGGGLAHEPTAGCAGESSDSRMTPANHATDTGSPNPSPKAPDFAQVPRHSLPIRSRTVILPERPYRPITRRWVFSEEVP